MALAWVRACIIIHLLVAWYEQAEEEEDFWQWVEDGLTDHIRDDDDPDPINGFHWGQDEPLAGGELPAQRKRWHVQESLFHALYS